MKEFTIGMIIGGVFVLIICLIIAFCIIYKFLKEFWNNF
jgi:hypothetical protein